MNHKLYLAGVFFMLSFFISCVPTSKLTYFTDISQNTGSAINPRTQKIIAPFDKLFIKVYSTDTKTLQIFNSTEEVRYGIGSNGIIGYPVDETGNINFPFAGNIKVSSMTTSQAAEKIQKALNDYVAGTTIIVKFIDNQITVMGEVNRQGVYPFVQDKLTIYEALGLGGGLTKYGNRKNIMLIRNTGERISYYRLNLSDSKILDKEFYYILPNDVLVVEPLGAISSSYQNMTITTTLTAITTLIAILLFAGVHF